MLAIVFIRTPIIFTSVLFPSGASNLSVEFVQNDSLT